MKAASMAVISTQASDAKGKATEELVSLPSNFPARHRAGESLCKAARQLLYSSYVTSKADVAGKGGTGSGMRKARSEQGDVEEMPLSSSLLGRGRLWTGRFRM